MKYGKNTELIKEVFDFFENHELLKQKLNSIDDIIIINDFDKALIWAWEQQLEDASIWLDIREGEAGEILGKYKKSEDLKKIESKINEYCDELDDYIEDNIPEEYSEIFDDVSYDAQQCALNRLVNGENDNFYEKVFQVYKAGGWPCGWKGEYPKGQMIVFFPIEDI